MVMQSKTTFDMNDINFRKKISIAGAEKRCFTRHTKILLHGFFLFLTSICLLPDIQAQVNAVEYGKNRVQFKKFKWQYYQTKNFNVYFNEGGQEIAKYVLQIAEKELPLIENEAEYSLQRRANIVIYNKYSDFKQTNIGLGQDWQSASGVTKLVNNKMVVYFDADHQKLRLQVRSGIARILVDNDLFGDDLGEFAGNQALLDLPVWMTDGYVAYLTENWNTERDDEMKSEILSGTYRKFNHFAFARPTLAGHAFWYYIEERYKKENVRQFLYLAKVYKNINKACLQVCKKKFKELLAEFMEWQDEKYSNDINRRRAYPKGNTIESFDINSRTDYMRFNVNPNKKNSSFVVTQFRKGIIRVLYSEDFEYKTLLKYGIRTYQNQMDPRYPMSAWDPKGTRIAVLYTQEGRLKLFIYDIVTRIKQYKLDLTDKFDQVQDMKYMLDSRTLLLSAVKNGHTDIYTFDIETEKVKAITNDVYDDLDASFVAFPGKTGIIFSSNRPGATAKSGDTTLPSNNRYNIFMITNFGDKPELNQITQLSSMKFGNARFPTQYNQNHFTFVSDLNGIGNRYAGFFTTKREGLDTLVLIGDDILRNPSAKEVDSSLRANSKTDVDSIAVVSITSDSTYTFPLTNYPSSLAESRIAGDNNQVSEVTRQSDEKILYKLKIDENALRRRNVGAQPTAYMKKLIAADRIARGENMNDGTIPTNPTQKQEDVFQSEFANEKPSESKLNSIFGADEPEKTDVLAKAKLFKYKPPKFYIETGSASFNNNILVTPLQPYAGGAGPIQLGSTSPLNALIRMGTSELMEDVKINGAFRLSTNLKDNEWMVAYQNYRRRIDWGGTYYRNVLQSVDRTGQFLGRTFTNLYQVNISYPFDESKRISVSTGIRSDRFVHSSFDRQTLQLADDKTLYSVTRAEYVYDNSLNPTLNIWNGLRYKFFFDWNRQVNKVRFADGPTMFNWGADVRYYYPIFRNFIWAGRAAANFSWGNQKTVYYLGGVDSWMMFGGNDKFDAAGNRTDRYFNTGNPPAQDNDYAFQGLAVNMRGFLQNVASGNNAVVLNSEFRLPVFATFLNRQINNAFIRNFQIIQFVDLGTAWNGTYGGIRRPEITYGQPPVQVRVKAGGIGPFVGGYGFGARSMLLGYFLKFDAGWPMDGVFRGRPIMYLSMGLDF
jgi:hypothetical protein